MCLVFKKRRTLFRTPVFNEDFGDDNKKNEEQLFGAYDSIIALSREKEKVLSPLHGKSPILLTFKTNIEIEMVRNGTQIVWSILFIFINVFTVIEIMRTSYGKHLAGHKK